LIVVPLVLVVAFLLGAIPFGVIIARRRGIDIREQGSGNIGATNVARVLGLGTGILVLLLDAAKGALATALAMKLCGWEAVMAGAGFAAILGHCFSPFLGGKGGKGVATALGVYVVLAPALALVGIAVFLVVAGRTRIPALGSLSGASAATIYAFVTTGASPLSLLAGATLALLLFTHRSNLLRLLTM
jgi:glycerol-3-phosphate acyltransferase PlsY